MRNSGTLARPPWFDNGSRSRPAGSKFNPPHRRALSIADLDAGEAAAIRLAEQLGETAFLLMDDLKGRGEAARRGIPSTGTLGVLQAASKNGYLVLRDVLPRLLRTNFYITPALVQSLLAQEQSRANSSD